MMMIVVVMMTTGLPDPLVVVVVVVVGMGMGMGMERGRKGKEARMHMKGYQDMIRGKVVEGREKESRGEDSG